ncbi:exodeoxyribonuclease III [Mytilus galloprovincialis]|uniref:Exodeoxyribonuclease III n=1 Tax=Mytilus galloprovincialis TaxID=29158 RepID=A0A8B6F265_MYTGA|nr:exodeoxyribonuclease III [Mytilus galloprovincialis]
MLRINHSDDLFSFYLLRNDHFLPFVYWNLSTSPAIFGQEITLTCHLEEISTNPTKCAERKWIVDPGNKVLTNRGVSSENKKYSEVISQHNPTFDLKIMNLAESDVNVDYTCTCDFKTFSKKLVLKEERFHYPPIWTNTNFSVHNGLLNVTVHMTKVYPVPNCSLMVGDSFIQSKAVRYSQNGIVYTVDFNAEYKFREKDCNKKPIVVCTFGMVSGPVRFEGDETYKCLIIKCTAPGISEFTITSNNTDVVPSTKVKYTCEFGYQLPAGDLGTRICQLGGTWSAPPPVCEVIKCTAPEINEFTITSTNTNVVPRTRVTYTCESGYYLHVLDFGIRECQLGGTWPAPPPACLDTHCTKEKEKQWAHEWGYKAFFSSGSSRSRGVAILIKNSFTFTIHQEKKDQEGNFIILDMTIQDYRLSLVAIYGPNGDSPTFFENIKGLVSGIKNSSIIMAGDWNVVQDFDKDTSNYSAKNNIRAHDKILDMIESLDLVDIWRALNPDTKRFTWRGPGLKQSRLDYFLISSDLEPFVKNVDMDISYRSDHSPVYLTLQFYNQIKGVSGQILLRSGRGTYIFDIIIIRKLEKRCDINHVNPEAQTTE